ncbi:2-(3-amino-3-carboxypropyl)histidine synthase subunit 2 [Paramormyrops kingsleyae]|uniref:2-(3-amino-3-carboxypropyl)histidine synthase subunit 2 n=1 Tax=Paramormyrops kingsleyae TaxID=1676925 RepID=A0A3B3Q2A5_9TELE|nr:2-(3-amino-3-carboxypropyl)histidine synthase subunit 2 [Paramormyrops kingsleyae]XP_023663157.1 2-(3-amino-3-carboxypropyl)histidine synthase subunit 2 [Paramormyrops kingsleyae]
MSVAFSSDGAQTIQKSLAVDVVVRETKAKSLEESYQIKETCDFIRENNFHKVALQFPDNLLVDSIKIASRLQETTGAKLYILGDTSYGSCCVDEVAAEHAGAQCIVHYGRACLSPSRRLPLMYVFGKRPIDLSKCATAFQELYPDHQSHVVVLYDVVYSHIIDDLLKLLQPEYVNVITSVLNVDGVVCKSYGQILQQAKDTGHTEAELALYGDRLVHKYGRQFILKEGCSIEDYSIFYVGQEGVTLTNFMMTWNKCSFCSFDPETMVGRFETININRALMKRYYLIEKAKDASIVGILVGTLGVANYLSIIDQLKKIIHKAGKKSYLFAMGKLNVAKLANFLEIDIFVLVACPENSLLDSSEFYRPVVTPFEMEIACNNQREWTGDYIIDFQDLLPGACSHIDCSDSNEDDGETTDVSLITGALRSSGFSSLEPKDAVPGSAVVQKNQTLMLAHANTAASFLSGRSWQGLDQKLGETPVVKAVEGRRGIAIAYEEEGSRYASS